MGGEEGENEEEEEAESSEIGSEAQISPRALS